MAEYSISPATLSHNFSPPHTHTIPHNLTVIKQLIDKRCTHYRKKVIITWVPKWPYQQQSALPDQEAVRLRTLKMWVNLLMATAIEHTRWHHTDFCVCKKKLHYVQMTKIGTHVPIISKFIFAHRKQNPCHAPKCVLNRRWLLTHLATIRGAQSELRMSECPCMC